MPVRLRHIVDDVHDCLGRPGPGRMQRLEGCFGREREIVIKADENGPVCRMHFMPVIDPKTVTDRVHPA